ncbi:MAG: hypothetical protein P8X57_06660 [Cyclobacteriaceae bacterium]
MTDPREFYKQKSNELEANASTLGKSVLRLSWARFVLFLVFITLFVYFANGRDYAAMVTCAVIFPLAFGTLVRVFNKLSDRLRFIKDLNTICQSELKRAALELDELDGGEEFMDRSHFYSYDLDLFGEHSLFKLLNRTNTPDGRSKIRDWMLEPARPQEINERQNAVRELSEKIKWILKFLAHGVSASSSSDKANRLKIWFERKDDHTTPPLVRIYLYLAPVLFIVILAGIIFAGLSIYWFVPLLIFNGVLLARNQEKIRDLAEQTDGNVRLLRSYESMIRQFSEAEFKAKRLLALQEPFRHQALRTIRSLRNLLDYMDGRGNMFYSLFNIIFLIDIHLIGKMANWKSSNREDLIQWFENLSEMEVLCSLGAHSFLHPDHILPAVEESWELQASSIGHPLIPHEECVTNDFKMGGKGKVVIITGSNMSGKSTFLRTVGINVVLGLMGAAVYARDMRIPVVRLFTGMRTEDDLASHISSFYAELRRIRYLLDTISDSGLPVLFMLDEILRGTNTEDRHRGSEGLVRQLADMDAFGFISTHDLAIGELARKDDRIKNYSFNSSIEEDEILFDYKISEGICRSFNASKLMEKMGIRLDK